MDTHPWTQYEVARARDEARLLRARAAMRAVELREDHSTPRQAVDPGAASSWFDRILRRSAVEQAPASTGAR